MADGEGSKRRSLLAMAAWCWSSRADDAERVGHLVAGCSSAEAARISARGISSISRTPAIRSSCSSSLGLEINLRENVHLKLDGGYRWVSGVELARLSDSDLSGASFGVGVRIGQF
ncbi:MAG: hypothetical protein U0527_10200 [Candidatus Eisenbacteria bacterium]